MSTIIRKGLSLMIILLLGSRSWSQGVLDAYIKQAFASNEVLKQENLKLEQALNGLQQARALYGPNIALQGSYTRAAGGRTIDFPIGDLLNPVYTTLNQLTHTSGFPQLSNASFLLNPDDFYDLKFHTTLPLVNAEIWYNRRIKKEAINERQASVNVYKRELAKNVKEAYYRYYMAGKALDIYNNALSLIDENVRVNESLVRNGARNNTVLLRAQAEQQKIKASIEQAENDKSNARLYFNFLLNRQADSDIDIDTTLMADNRLQIESQMSAQREELVQLNAAINMYGLGKSMQRSYLVPKFNMFADVGSQAYQFQFNNKSRYFFGGLSLQWDLFASGLHKYKIAAADKDLSLVRSSYEYTRQALELQSKRAENDYHTAVSTLRNAQAQLQFAHKYYTDEMRMYKEGQALYIELIDALNQLTTARLQENIARAGILVALADVERQRATYPIDKN